jgi:hypothetical protein
VRAILAGCVLGAFAAMLAIAGSCTVDRKSAKFACSNNSQCDNGRSCQDGFCVTDGSQIDGNGCPSPCTSCDLNAKVCDIQCMTSSCGSFSCPDGYTCTIECIGNNVCHNIDCSNAAGCTITCLGTHACNNMSCGSGPCDVMCSGTQGCGDVHCSDSCKCDVQGCSGGNCGTMSCPDHGGPCTTDGNGGSPCDSNHQASCKTC